MPKLENFPTYLKIDDRRFVKNTLEYEVFDDIVRVYHFTSPNEIFDAVYSDWTDSDDVAYPSLVALTNDLDVSFYSDSLSGTTSVGNSTTTLLTASSTFTGEWEFVGNYNSIVVSAKTDQDGTYFIEFSPDGVNTDSSLIRYYRTNQIEPPHRVTITRNYVRVRFTNTSSSDQTFLRLQCLLGDKIELNVPLDATMAQDYDAIATRPTDFTTEVALGKRQGASTWNKFGYNEDIDSAAAEVIASYGGVFDQKLTNAETMDIVSTSTDDTNSSGTGARQLVIFGVGGDSASDRNDIVDVIALNGTSTVTTTKLFWGINRMTIFTSGTGDSNIGTITATASSSGNTMAEMPALEGTTQQCIFYVPESHQFLTTWLYLNVIKSSGGGSPDVTFKAFVYSEVVDSIFEVYRDSIDVSGGSPLNLTLTPPEPFVIGEKSIFWIEAETTANNTSARGRFSGKLIRDIGA